jgi:hypothetical protein
MFRRLAVIIAGMSTIANAAPPADRNEMNGEVVFVSETPDAPSSLFTSWIKLQLRTSDGQIRDAYDLYYSEEDPIPHVGERCRLRYRMGEIGGTVGNGLIPTPEGDVVIVQELICRGTGEKHPA